MAIRPGDALLAAFGRMLAASLRKSDLACRYGGEEFWPAAAALERWPRGARCKPCFGNGARCSSAR